MASYTIRSAASSSIYAKLVLTEQSQSVADNTTTLLWQLYMWNTQAKPNWYAYEEHNIVRVSINGQYVLNTDDFGMISLQYEQSESSAKLIASDKITIAHDSNGSKSIKASFYVEQGWYGAYKWSGPETTISLTTIARASKPSLSVSSLTFGGDVTIYTNRASDSFTHTLTYSIGSTSETIGTAKGVTTSQTWRPDKSLAAQFPNDPSGRVAITCTTYNGSTQIGDPVTIYLELNLSSDMVPTISSVTFKDVGQSTFSSYIQSKSKLEYTVNASGNNGSTITSYQVKINGSTYYSKTNTTGYLTTVGTNTVTVTVVDSRGQTATRNDIYFTVVEYSPPRISSLKAYRCDGSGNYDEDGANMYVIFTGTIAALSGNTRNVVLKTGPAGGTLEARSISFSGTTYSFTGTLLIAAETSKSYNVEVTIADKYGLWSVPYTTSVSTASILMNIRENKDGMAIGKMAEKAKTLQLGWDLETHGALNALEGVSTSAIVHDTRYTTALSSSGWYRIFTSHTTDSGGFGSINFTIGHNWYYNRAEVYEFSVSVGYAGDINITQLSGAKGGAVITKIRVVWKTDRIYYIDFYYSGTNVNNFYVHGSGGGTFCTPTAASVPDGYSTYEFDTTTGCKSSSGFTGDIVNHTSGNVTTIHNTADSHSYAYFTTSDNDPKASIGYWQGMAYIGEETGSCARIGVTSSGVPQYWSSYDPSTAKNLLHTGNITSHMTHMHYGTYDVNGGGYYKININSTGSWMLCFTIRVYQGYRATDIMVSGYNYGQYYWHDPSAVLLGDSDNLPMNVYFGYDSAWNLWVAIPIGDYTGLDIFNVTNGYAQVIDSNLFSISRVGSLSGTTQTTVSALPPTCSTELITSKSGIWNWVKYNSGLAMCWGNTGICNTDFSATWSSWYIHDYLFAPQRYPFDFVAVPQVFVTQGPPGSVVCDWAIYSSGSAHGGQSLTQYTPTYSAFRPKTTGATVNLSLNLFAIGRWK